MPDVEIKFATNRSFVLCAKFAIFFVGVAILFNVTPGHESKNKKLPNFMSDLFTLELCLSTVEQFLGVSERDLSISTGL